MTDVINLDDRRIDKKAEEKQELVFVCRCTCQSFYIHEQHVECVNCGAVPRDDETGLEWRRVLPEKPADVSTLGDDGGATSVRVISDTVLTKRRFMTEINKWAETDELAMLVAYNNDGAGKHWLTIHTEEQKQWVLRKLSEIRTYVDGKKTSDAPT